MLSNSKQGKYAERGLIMEAVLQKASEGLCQEPRDRPKSGKGLDDNVAMDRCAIKEGCTFAVKSETQKEVAAKPVGAA